MSCFHPNIISYLPGGFKKDGELQRNKDGSLKKYFFHGAGYEVYYDGDYRYELEKNHSFVNFFDTDNIDYNGELPYSLMVPCQQCIGCRIDTSKHWADRMVMEQLVSPENTCFFITLTYNNDNIDHLRTGYDFEKVVEGEPITIEGLTLFKKDFQDFNKRLREKFRRFYDHDGIRFYCVGEYGEKFRRPHFHVCYFNLPIPDLKYYTTNFQGDTLYTSPLIESTWGKGYCVIGELNWETCAYTARYVTKKYKGEKSAEFYEAHGNVIPEFSLSSNRPGIGGEYFHLFKHDIYKYDSIQLPSTINRDGHTTVPRYFDKLLERYQKDNPTDTSIRKLEKIRADRRAASELDTFNRRILTGVFDKEYFSFKEENFKKSTINLHRLLD